MTNANTQLFQGNQDSSPSNQGPHDYNKELPVVNVDNRSHTAGIEESKTNQQSASDEQKEEKCRSHPSNSDHESSSENSRPKPRDEVRPSDLVSLGDPLQDMEAEDHELYDEVKPADSDELPADLAANNMVKASEIQASERDSSSSAINSDQNSATGSTV